MINLEKKMIAPKNNNENGYEEYRTDLLINQTREHIGLSHNERLGPIQFAENLIEIHITLGQLAPATWRQYKWLAIQLLETLNDDEASEAISILESQIVSKGGQNPTKSKQISTADFNALISRLIFVGKRPNALYAHTTAGWLQATIITGLRPTEWEDAVVIGSGTDYPILKVTNAKADLRRSFGKYRHIHLRGLTEQDIHLVVSFVTTIQSLNSGMKFPALQESCRQQLKRTCYQLWRRKKSISLTSARHEFKNRAQKVMPWEYVSALLGHKKKESGGAYGSGKGSFAPVVDARANFVLPDTQDVLSVLRHNQTNELKNELTVTPEIPPLHGGLEI